MKTRPSANRRSQRGATLIITIIMLLLVTMVTLSSLRSTTTEERLAGNARDRDKAFQAAEAAVQYCLAQVHASTPLLPQTPAATTADPIWEVDANWSSTSTVSSEVTLSSAGLYSNPRCITEKLNTAGSYRVTGRAVGASDQTVVMLQATYSTE